jgi:hypothetical protein
MVAVAAWHLPVHWMGVFPRRVTMAKAPLKYQLINPLKIKSDQKDLDFSTAQQIAQDKARTLCPDPTLICWYDGTTGQSHPPVEGSSAGKPGWLDYAEACNCDMTVDINDEQFIFIYLTQL